MQSIKTPIGLIIRITEHSWDIISTIKHPIMKSHFQDVVSALVNPDEIRRSKSDLNVYLFYKIIGNSRWVCAVTKDAMSKEGFLITAYLTDKIKEGDVIWTK